MRGPLFIAKGAEPRVHTPRIPCMFLQTSYGVMKHSEANRPYSQSTEDWNGSTFRRQIPRGRCDERAYQGRPIRLGRSPLVKEGQ